MKVDLINLDSTAKHRTYSGEISRETGRAEFPDVEPGRYEIRVTPKPGSAGHNNSRYGSDYREVPAEGRSEFGFQYWGLPMTNAASDDMSGKLGALVV